jgi:hypothetical protein
MVDVGVRKKCPSQVKVGDEREKRARGEKARTLLILLAYLFHFLLSMVGTFSVEHH